MKDESEIVKFDIAKVQYEIDKLKEKEKAERLAESFLKGADATREAIKGDGAKEMAWIAVGEDPRYQDIHQAEAAVRALMRIWRDRK